MALAQFFDPARRTRAHGEETELSLPEFYVDQNNFLMFRDPDLGGCGVFEVTPHVWDASWTHIDDFQSDRLIDGEGDGMTSSLGTRYADSRRCVVSTWMAFLNALLPLDMNSSQIHMQILGKKSHDVRRGEDDAPWVTEADYLLAQTAGSLSSVSFTDDGTRIRYRDYYEYLKRKAIDSHSYVAMRDAEHSAAYDTRWFIVISYTPSSEGWWYDGRDSDYYMVDDTLDLSHPLAMFNNPRLVDSLVTKWVRRRRRKERKGAVNTAGDIFPLATDVTTSVIHSRMLEIENIYARVARSLPRGVAMPFSLRRLTGRETAALVAFFGDLLTPYWDKAMRMQGVDMDDVLMGVEASIAVTTGDIGGITAFTEDVIAGTVDLSLSDAEFEEFRRRHANPTLAGEPQPAVPQDGDPFGRLGLAGDTDENGMWGSMGLEAPSAQGEDAEMDEFKSRYRRRRENIAYRRRNEEIAESLRRQHEMDALRSGDAPGDPR